MIHSVLREKSPVVSMERLQLLETITGQSVVLAAPKDLLKVSVLLLLGSQQELVVPKG